MSSKREFNLQDDEFFIKQGRRYVSDEYAESLAAHLLALRREQQRKPTDSETVCHACGGSGWTERGY